MAIQMNQVVPERYSFWIAGTSPLIQHAWTNKGLEMMRMTAAERRKREKGKREPEAEAAASAYYTKDGDYGIPLLAFKAACIGACHRDQGLEKTAFKKSFFVALNGADPIARMECDDPVVREDIVRVGQGATDLRYRPEFKNWRVNIVCEVNSEILSPEDVVKVVNRAGFSVGIGEWRPEKGGEFGRFALDENAPFEVLSMQRAAA